MMKKYLLKVKELIAHFKSFIIKKVPHAQNMQTDQLARLGSTPEEEWDTSQEHVRLLLEPTINVIAEVLQV